MHIELLGAAGAGKSSLFRAIVTSWPDRFCDARHHLAFINPSKHLGAVRAYLSPFFFNDNWKSLHLFLLNEARLTPSRLRVQQVRWVRDTVSCLWWVSRQEKPAGYWTLDEGIAQRVMSLSSLQASDASVDRALELIDRHIDCRWLTIFLDAKLETIENRQMNRDGRIRGDSASQLLAAQKVAAKLEGRGWPVIRLQAEVSEDEMLRRLETLF